MVVQFHHNAQRRLDENNELGSPPTTQPTSASHGEMHYKRKKQNRRSKDRSWGRVKKQKLAKERKLELRALNTGIV